MMLRHMARSCRHGRLLLAGAYRTTETVTPDLLGDVLGAIQAETECTVIRLRALGAEAIGQLVAAEARAPVSSSLAGAIAAHTGGNPFFAKEMIRHLLLTGLSSRPDGWLYRLGRRNASACAPCLPIRPIRHPAGPPPVHGCDTPHNGVCVQVATTIQTGPMRMGSVRIAGVSG